jgi:hypothetical protein
MFIAMVTFGGLSAKQLGAKLNSMGCKGSSVFQNARASLITQMKENVAPFMMGIHCFAHRTNLVVLVLSKLTLVAQLEAFCKLYMGFSFIHLRNSLNIKACVMCLQIKEINNLET